MKDTPITVISHPQLLDHDPGEDHPEVRDRLNVIAEQLHRGPLATLIEFLHAEPVKRQWLLTYHTDSWLLRFEEEVLAGRSYISHPDNQVCYETYQAALFSAGAAIAGVDRIEAEPYRVVFCASRPPGHHALAAAPSGFCFLNNCVIAARYWQEKYERRRICVLDFDAHHGNGIQAAFEKEADTLYISLHEHPDCSFPGTGLVEEQGLGAGTGTIVNIPLQPYTTDATVISKFEGCIVDRIEQFQPEAMIIAAGFDGHQQDDLSALHYSTELFGKMGEYIGLWAGKFCQGRIVSVLEGGYHLATLGKSVEAYLAGLYSHLQKS